MPKHKAIESWTAPIHIEDPDTGQEATVGNTEQAKDILDHAWPAYHGSQFERAEHACEEALTGQASPEEARRAFIAAAVEAHLHLHS